MTRCRFDNSEQSNPASVRHTGRTPLRIAFLLNVDVDDDD